jgi:hypothetical protein
LARRLVIDTLVAALFCLLFFRYINYRGRAQAVTLLPYQQGVLFVRGLPVRDVGPGTHRLHVGKEFLVHLDTRPIAVRVENQAVALQDGATAVYSISANAEVKDVRKVLYAARNFNQMPPYLLRRSARRVLNAGSSETLMTGATAIEKAIVAEADSRLAEAGFALSSFRLHQLIVNPPPEGPARAGSEPPREERLVN